MNLLDIAIGQPCILVEEWGEWPAGTVVIRGNEGSLLDDEDSVAFTLPDGDWNFFRKDEICLVTNEELKQRKIRELEETINKAQEQIEALKNGE